MSEATYRILIIDDNPFPTRECCFVLINKFCERLIISKGEKSALLNRLFDVYNRHYEDLITEFPNTRGKVEMFDFGSQLQLTIYNYDTTKYPTENQAIIVDLIRSKKINILWTDKGHSDFFISQKKMYEVKNDKKSDAVNLYENDDIVQSLISNGVKQIALYSFNPKLTYRDLEYIRKEKIKYKFGDKISIENIYVLETSPILNLYEKGSLSAGNEIDNFLGDISAYKYYGKLLGNILFDLFLQVSDIKQSLTSSEKRYNFFKPENRDFLRYYKLLNSDYYDFITNYPARTENTNILSKLSGFRIGLVSFHGNILGREEYLIDVPYKEYYQIYDNQLELVFNNHEKIGDLITTINEDGIHASERWLYFRYQKLNELDFQYDYRLHPKLNTKNHLVELFLPLLHTGIFYEPGFYETDFSKIKFNRVSKEQFDSKKDSIEVIYLFRNEEFDGIKGVSHLAFWRRNCEYINLIRSDIELFTEIIWETVYRLVEAKFEATLVDLLQKESINQATRAAISQVMARNTSHNIGAHVMNKLTNADFLQNFCSYSNCLKSYKPDKDFEGSNSENHKPFNQLAIFNNYVKCRMDYLADISFGTPLMQTNKYVYGDLFMELDKVRLLLEHISGLDNFEFKIEFKRNGKDFEKDENGNILNDLLVAIPNDILGTQAFYNILENIIRNTAKHSYKKTLGGKPVVVFTVNFIDDIEESEEHNQAINRNEIENVLTEFIAVEVYDNIPVVGDKRELMPEEKKEYRDKMKKDLEMFATKIDALIFNQNSKLNDDILQKDNKIRSYSLGLVEMDASAAYLRKRPVEYINHKSYDIHYDEWWSRDTEVNEGDQEKRGTNCRHFLKAFKKTEDINNYLGYRFFLHRPAVVLVVTNELENDKEKKDKLRKEGIWVITPQSFEQDLKGGKVYPHEFVVFEEIAENDKEIFVKDLVEKYKTSLPIRVLNSITKISELVEKSADKIYEECWEKWEVRLKNKYHYSDYSNGQYPIINGKKARISNHLRSNVENMSPEDSWKGLKKNTYFLEPASSKSQSYLPGLKNQDLEKYPSILRENVVYKIQIAEALLTNVFVLDERVQHGCDQRPMGILQHKVYQAMRIFVPRKINLADSTLDVSAILKIINDKISCCDFILLHYSILERMFNDETNRLKAINDFLIDLSNQLNVVVTSGRGIPDELPSEVRFINLSSVIMAFNEVRGKYLINYLLNSSRKTNRI